MKGKWLYDIFIGEMIVGNQGDYEFDTKEQALNDANDYIENGLATEYKCNRNNFSIDCYQAII